MKTKRALGELDLNDEEALEKFTSEIHSNPLFKHVEKISKSFNLDKDTHSLIYDAKEARNYIAHELTQGIQSTIETDDGREIVVSDLENTITKIAKANIVIVTLMAIITNDLISPPSYINSYVDMVLNWVLEVEDE